MLKWIAPAVATLGLAFAVTTARAADEKPVAAAGGGTVTGTVVDKDGKAAEGVKIRIMKPMQRGGARGGAGGAAPKVADAPADKPAAPGGRQRPTPVAEGTSDKDGKFSIANVPAGEYMVMAVLQGSGMARGRVTVKDGETASVELKLAERQPGQGRGGAGGRRPGGGAPAK
jgi:hypothetical protein